MKYLLSASLCTLAVAMAQPAFAQDSAATPAQASAVNAAPQVGNGVQDIVVTAQRREENLQRTPLAIVAVTGADLARAGVTEAQDLNKLVPGLKIGNTGSMTQFFVNGVGSGVANAYGDPTIAFNADGIYIARPTGVNGVFYDLARVEVLKGPQGTLYGRNAAAGAVNVITNRPKFEDSLDATLDVGNYSLVKFTAAGNAKLTDTLAIRISGLVSRHNGYLSDGYNDEDDHSVRGQILWRPDSHFSWLNAVDYYHQGGKGNAAIPVPFVDPSNPWAGPSTDGVTAVLSAATPTVPVANRIRFFPNDGFLNNRYWGIRSEATYNFDTFGISAILGHRRTIMDANSIVGAFEQLQYYDANQNSAEVRVSSIGNGRFKWLVGGYYFHESLTQNAVTQRYFQGTSTLSLTPLTDETKAVFGQATYEIVRGLRVTGGYRYNSEQKSEQGFNRAITNVVVPANGSLSYTKSNFKAGIEYDVAPRSMAYATYSTGFKAGGFFQGGPPNTYKPENLTSYVVGIKNRFFDNKLQLNLEGFYWDYRDKQFATFAVINPAPATALITINIPKVTFKGVTADFVFVPWHGGQFSGNAQYLDAVNKVFTYPSLVPTTNCPSTAQANGGFLIDCSGKPLSQAPKFSTSLAFVQTFDTSNGGTVAAGINTHFETRTLASQTMDYVAALYQDKWSMTDLNVTYTTPNKHWSVQLYVNNVFDAAVKTNGASQPTTPTVYFANILPPRLFGARFSAHY